MTKRELLARLTEQIAAAERFNSHAPVATVLRAVLEDVAALDGVPASPPAADVLLTLDQAAGILNVEKRWFTINREALPFVLKLGRNTVRVSTRKLERWLEAHRAA